LEALVFGVRAKHSDDKLSVFFHVYFPNASPLQESGEERRRRNKKREEKEFNN
jgi:hypothetical protein